MRVPHEIEEVVRDAVTAVLGERALATGPLARAIVDRSQRYTSERDKLAAPRDADADLAARAAFFTIADAMKLAVPIAELHTREALPAARTLRVVDLGAGCGAMSLGLIAALDLPAFAPLAALDPRPVALTLIDRDARALDIARRAIAALGARRSADHPDRVTIATRTGDVARAEIPPAELVRRSTSSAGGIATRTGDVARAEIPPAELVLVGSVLNELAPETALAVVERALDAISDDGAVIVIEPALRETARRLHAIRDAVIAKQRGCVFAPCTRRCAPCTALADERDWCHEDRALELPPQTAELARLTHLRDSGMKLSYLVLRKRPLDLVAAGPDAWRVVSAPFVEKGKREVIGCSERGRVRLRLLKRHRDPGNRVFEKAERGDVVVIDRGIEGERVEITADTRVERITHEGDTEP